MRPPDIGDPGGSSSSGPHGKQELQPEVVLYTASASASRRRGRSTVDRYALRALLRGYGLTIDERDVSTSKAHRCELKSLLAARGCAFSLPQLLMGGRLLGGPDHVRQLHQAGGLRSFLDEAPRPSPAFVCQACKRVGSVPCPKCSESRNKMLDHGIIEEEEDRVVLFYPTQDVSMGGRDKEMDASFSVSLGAMRPLLKKLGMMLGPHGCKLTKGVNDRSQLLKDDLEEIGAYLEDLLDVEDPPLAAKCWMKEAHELSYDILDCIDNFVPPESLGYKSDHKMTHVKIPKGLKWEKQIEYAAPDVSGHVISKIIRVDVIRAPRKLKWYQQMVEKVSEFRIYAQEVVRRYERYQVHCCSTSAASRFPAIGPMMPIPPPPCEKTCSGLVIDGRMSKFINSQLDNDENQQLKVVSIHGSGCLGKTTLAKVLYNKIGRQFHCRAFIRVSKKPDMKRLFHDMLAQIQRKQPQASQDHSDELHVTAENIRNHLDGKRYLIVVDDLWDISAWDIINQVFPKGTQGSRIITTTQIEDVALACCCHHSELVFEIKPLDDDHSRNLFFGRIFGCESDCPVELKQVSSQIVEICGGLPLATISIAGLLANQSFVSVELLTNVHDSLVSCLSSNLTSERTRQILNLSYNSLPHYLKTCLLQLGMYPEGSIIFKHDLVRQWVAEGFVAASEGKNMEEVAGMYFDELVDRRFIQPMSINFNNEVVSCTVHSVVHDLIVHKSAEENFLVVVYFNRKNLTLSHKVRRLSLQLGDAKYAKIPANIRKSQVRSLGVFGLSECMPCIGEFKLVHVLNLQLSGHHNGDQGLAIDLTGISELFHLRYLKIVCDVSIKLPGRMKGLQCLETLDVMDTPRGTYVPWDIIYLPRLLHLSLPPETNLLDWAVSIGTLGMLNHLEDVYIPTPPPSSDHDHVKRSMGALGTLILIGGHDSLKTVKVVAHGSSVKYDDASKATINWFDVAPPANLQRFECSPHSRIIFNEIPWRKGQLGHLCILKIEVRELPGCDVETLRLLPALTALSLYVETAPSVKIIFDKAGFPVLKYLKMRFTSGMAWLKFEADALPNLWKVRLVFNSIPQMDQRLNLFSESDQWKQYRHGTALISIERMTGLREVSAKFGGAAVDLQYVSRMGVVSNHPGNPIIDVQLVDSGSHGDKRTSWRSLEPSSRLLPPGVEEGGEQQAVVSWSNTIDVIGRELFIYCLHRLSRWDYASIASLNRDFNSVVRNGDIYRLRRKNGVAEHWLYLSCGNNPPEWDAYDPSTGRWIQVPNMPPAESYGWDSLAVGTELLAFGGGGRVALRYSILTNSWTGLADADAMNTPRFVFGSASVGEKAYVAGGMDYFSAKIALSSAEMYDSETHTWTPLPSMNRARYGCSGAFMDDKFYVVGGNSRSREVLTCGEEYDLNLRSWTVIHNMSRGLNQTSQGAPPLIAVVNNELYGADYSENNDLKQYDKLDNKWITLGKLPVQSKNKKGWDMGFRACGDRLIVIGRPNNSTDEKVVELHSWTPDEQPPVWNFIATRPYMGSDIVCAAMGC